MKIKILAIVLLILFTCGLDLVIGDLPGGGGEPGGNCPCYSVGQIVSQSGWWQGGYYYTIIETYIGNCQIRSDWYQGQTLIHQDINPGGCTCPCSVPVDPHQED